MIIVDSATHGSKGSKNDSKLTGATSASKSGQKTPTLEFSQTPKKYRRRPLTQDEIDLVTVTNISFSMTFSYELLAFRLVDSSNH